MDGIKKRILLVEDEFLVAILELKDLEKKGYLVQHVGSGEEAVKAILDAAIHVDLILMDIDLGPGIDGTQAAERILKHNDIPVVFLSSHTEPEVVEKTEKITSYGYVVKNTGVTVLDASIKMALKLFEARMERGRAENDLRESEERYRTITETLTDYIFTCTIENGKVVKTVHGPGCIAVTGYSAGEFSSDPCLWFSMVHPDDADRVRNHAAVS